MGARSDGPAGSDAYAAGVRCILWYWEFNRNQAVRTGKWFAHRRNGGDIELYDLEADPQQQLDLAAEHKDLVSRIRQWMDESHTPGDVWPSPGESEKDFQQRRREAGISPRKPNIDG